MNALTFDLVVIISWMNILHAVTSAKRETAPQIRKLKSSCGGGSDCPVSFPKAELKKRLTPIEYHVTQERGTEKAFSGKYVSNKEEGVYTCVVCGNQLFSSDTKYDSKSGWPAFYDVVSKKHITVKDDMSHGIARVEAKCADCNSHIGHVFDDGPKPTGLRFCVNSASLDFKKQTTV
ncbi:methionine-R-sulfoxide reductase B3, mitochondrial-like isoform X2 [Crassostrea angulata]|uniref:methionine-R-sulfoxide reductase B3, mitochondrial-like isoform X2 n=1 Tax=Magallana angulata TaxID=2784310 RepID=UPI0022B136C3|nr:methionine-R-sulfoxide reductase B3, mitochondrial-like isoform X2 [Crassostrea angulata]